MTQRYNPKAERRGHGIYTLDDIRARCRVDDETGCWVWGLWSRTGDTPRVSLPPGVIAGCDQRTMSVPRAAWMMHTGKPLQDGGLVWRTCSTPTCCNPAHMLSGTRAQEGEWRRRTGVWRGDPRRAVVNLTTAKAQALPPELVHAVAQSIAAGEPRASVAARTGLNESTISRIANGRHLHQRLVRGASEPDAALCRGVRMSSLTFLMPWPASNLSPNARQHWSALARAKKVQRVAWAVHARSQGAGRLLAERAELRLQFHPPTKARRDLDNCLAACKAGLDGLADVLGIDDSQWSIQIEMAEPVKGGSVRVEVVPCHV